MIFVNSIYDLQYYNKPSWAECTCEYVTQANDLALQADLSSGILSGAYAMTISILSADGLTVYNADISSYFDIYYAENPNTGYTFFNIRAKQFAPEMCTHPCWILRVKVIVTLDGSYVINLFDKYTERYCQFTCCEPAGDIVIGDETTPTPVQPSPTPLVGECGKKLIRIVSTFPCNDNFSGEYYGIPTNVKQGTASFGFSKVSTIWAHVLPQPTEITRQISYNCKLQRTEAKRTYLVEGMELLPAWKMREIENQLCAPELWIDDYPVFKQYQYAGGTAFTKPDGIRSCEQYFKLEVILEDCTIRQTFGCNTKCTDVTGAEGYSSFFVVPDNYVDGNYFYNDAGEPIAQDLEALLNWFTFQNNVTDAQLISASPVECSYYAIIGLKGIGRLPNIIYVNNTSPASRLYSITADTLSEICELIPQVQCATPIIGAISLEPVDCATPVIGAISLIPVTPLRVYLSQAGNWEIVQTGSPAEPENTWADVLNNQVNFNIKVRNYTIFDDGEFIYGEAIGVMPMEARPQSVVLLHSGNNGQLTDDETITIDTYGVITYTGLPTTGLDGSYVEIEFNNLIYNL